MIKGQYRKGFQSRISMLPLRSSFDSPLEGGVNTAELRETKLGKVANKLEMMNNFIAIHPWLCDKYHQRIVDKALDNVQNNFPGGATNGTIYALKNHANPKSRHRDFFKLSPEKLTPQRKNPLRRLE
jgi:hypothetical protein